MIVPSRARKIETRSCVSSLLRRRHRLALRLFDDDEPGRIVLQQRVLHLRRYRELTDAVLDIFRLSRVPARTLAAKSSSCCARD